MQLYELDILLNSLQLSFRQYWEQTRFISYVISQCNSKKKLKPTDIIKFEWDNELKNTAKTNTVTSEDISRLKEKMNNILKNKQ